MRVYPRSAHARADRSKNPFYRFSAVVLAALLIVGCSAQPMTLDQELTAVAVAGAVGAGSGAIFAYSASKSYPVSILLGAAGMAGVVLIYEEIKREATMQSTPFIVPTTPDQSSPPNQNP